MNKIRNVSVIMKYEKIYPYFLKMDLANNNNLYARQILFKKIDRENYQVTLNGIPNYPKLLSFFQDYGINKDQMIITIV